MSKCQYQNKRRLKNGQLSIRACPGDGNKKLVLEHGISVKLCLIHFERVKEALEKKLKEAEDAKKSEVDCTSEDKG